MSVLGRYATPASVLLSASRSFASLLFQKLCALVVMLMMIIQTEIGSS